ncbi:MAG: hypothetical protein K0S61_4844 [Anaerocolumna sp.]|jgi:hypothetical protein|nr:hypothetical protein [Anaerocolumna sp.]
MLFHSSKLGFISDIKGAYNGFNEQKPTRFLAKAVPASISFLKV